MKHIEAITLRNDLEAVSGLIGYEINYCIKKNLQRLKTALKPLVELENENKVIITKFTEEQTALRKKYATVDGDVRYKIHGKTQTFDIPAAVMADFEKDLSELKKVHRADLDAFEKKAEEYAKFLTEGENDFKITPLKKEFVPKDISTENMNRIWALFEEND